VQLSQVVELQSNNSLSSDEEKEKRNMDTDDGEVLEYILSIEFVLMKK